MYTRDIEAQRNVAGLNRDAKNRVIGQMDDTSLALFPRTIKVLAPLMAS
jgi:hypothetical protein